MIHKIHRLFTQHPRRRRTLWWKSICIFHHQFRDTFRYIHFKKKIFFRVFTAAAAAILDVLFFIATVAAIKSYAGNNESNMSTATSAYLSMHQWLNPRFMCNYRATRMSISTGCAQIIKAMDASLASWCADIDTWMNSHSPVPCFWMGQFRAGCVCSHPQ